MLDVIFHKCLLSAEKVPFYPQFSFDSFISRVGVGFHLSAFAFALLQFTLHMAARIILKC